MDAATALKIYTELESYGIDRSEVVDLDGEPSHEQWREPTYAVRLDAKVNDYRERECVVRVTGGDRDQLRDVLTVAAGHGVSARIENSGIELR